MKKKWMICALSAMMAFPTCPIAIAAQESAEVYSIDNQSPEEFYKLYGYGSVSLDNAYAIEEGFDIYNRSSDDFQDDVDALFKEKGNPYTDMFALHEDAAAVIAAHEKEEAEAEKAKQEAEEAAKQEKDLDKEEVKEEVKDEKNELSDDLAKTDASEETKEELKKSDEPLEDVKEETEAKTETVLQEAAEEKTQEKAELSTEQKAEEKTEEKTEVKAETKTEEKTEVEAQTKTEVKTESAVSENSPVVEKISVPISLYHGQDKKLEIENRGTIRVLPNFQNEKAWKKSASKYNTPYLWGQCTWFAWGRFYEMYGFDPGFTGDGYMCAAQLVSAHSDKFELSKTPAAGAVFSADAAHNHVGIVLDYDEETDMLLVQEGNLDGVSNPNWAVAIEDYRTIEISSSDLSKLYGNVVYAVPKEGVTFVGGVSKKEEKEDKKSSKESGALRYQLLEK